MMRAPSRAIGTDLPTPPVLDGGTFRLWGAVLERALADRRDPDLSREAKVELLTWVRSERVQPASFCWLCQVVGLEPAAVRRAFVA